MCRMDRLPAVVFFGLVAIAQVSVAKASSQQIAGQQSSLRSESAAVDLPVLPLRATRERAPSWAVRSEA
jgi:hypothetical protein